MQPLKRCKAECKRELPLSAFGVNKRFEDGLHIYCRVCVAQRVRDRRAGQLVMRKRNCLSGEQKVLKAIRDGVHTANAIMRRTRLSEEEVDGILAELVLERRQLVTKVAGEERLYFTKAA